MRPWTSSRSRDSRLLIAERFAAPVARLAELDLPLDVIAARPRERLRLFVIGDHGFRTATLAHPTLSAGESIRLSFAPFDSPAGATFILGALEVPGGDTSIDADREQVRTAAAGREAITLACRGVATADGTGDLVLDRDEIAVYRIASPSSGIRTAYWLDAFWCDANGIFLQGWVHAYEHRVRALRVESAGCSERVEQFSDRPDLLVHYPEHDHVRHAGFIVYLACAPGHPVTLSLETDAGVASLPLSLPEGPIPAWRPEPKIDDEISPAMRRFADLANALGGRVLQIGSRVPWGNEAVPPRRLFRKVTGLDIHPGCNVDVAGDAHALSTFLRPGSFDGVLSFSVLEHIEVPWVVAAEINRILKRGGVAYHQVPGAWPAHAQPNDFWRFSSEGLRVLFGPATGFEILEAGDSGQAAIIPAPSWRRKHLSMPTVPAYAAAEIVVRKVSEIEPGAVAWPLTATDAATRSNRYPLSALRPSTTQERS